MASSVAPAATSATPPFAKSFPDDKDLQALLAAFVSGNYAKVRRDTPKLLKSASNEDVRRAATELLSRTKADPLSIYLFALAALLLVVLSGYWVVYDHAAPSPPGPVERVK